MFHLLAMNALDELMYMNLCVNIGSSVFENNFFFYFYFVASMLSFTVFFSSPLLEGDFSKLVGFKNPLRRTGLYLHTMFEL